MGDPLIWKRLRVLANPLRLEMLSLLHSGPDQYVQVVGNQIGCSEDVASKHLQRLGDHGFLSSKRRGRYLFYTINHADPLTKAVIGEICRNGTDIGGIMKSLTSFTHERRIVIVNVLRRQAMDSESLNRATRISMEALVRHMKKLRDRGVVGKEQGKWSLCDQSDTFKEWLLNFVA